MRLATVAALPAAHMGPSACAGGSSHLSITVSPDSATFDVPFSIDVRGLPAGARARVSFSGRSYNGRAVEFHVGLRADERGRARLDNFYLYARLDPPAGWPTRLTITASSGNARAVTHATRTIRVTHEVLTTDERP